MARSIYVPLEAETLALLHAMGKAEHRDTHQQAGWLISQAVDRWRAERVLEGTLQGEDELEEVA